MKAGGPHVHWGGREEDLIVPSVLNPRTDGLLYPVLELLLGMQKDEKDLGSPQSQRPAASLEQGEGDDASMYTGTFCDLCWGGRDQETGDML